MKNFLVTDYFDRYFLIRALEHIRNNRPNTVLSRSTSI